MKKILLIIIVFTFSAFPFSGYSQNNYIIDSLSFSSLELDGGAVGMCLTDINQDGDKDLMSIGDHGSPFVNTPQHGISTWFGNGTATGWSLFQNGDFGYGGIDAGDLNKDGLMDVAYGMHHNYSSTDFGDQILEAALGDGSGMSWTPWDDSLATAGETYGMFGTDMGDMDNDGWLDIGSTSFGCCAGYHVYKNLGTGAWQHAFGYVGGNASHKFIFGDMNGDGNLDFATTHQDGTPYFGDGTGNFINSHLNLPVQTTLGHTNISLGDVDGDGADDLCFAMYDGIFVYRYDTATNLWGNLSGSLPTSGYFSGARLYDMNQDGFLDVIGVTGNTLQIWEGNGGLSWTPQLTLPVSNMSYTRDMVIGDVTHDGRPEIFLWAEFPISLFTYENRLYMLHDTSAAVQFDIQAKKPVPGECYPAGSIRFIEWNSALHAGHAGSVALEFSSMGIAGPWSSVASGLPDNGVYQWTVPFLTSVDCLVRYILTDSTAANTDTAVTANAFSVGCGIDTKVLAASNEQLSFRVFPNPAHNQFRIVFPKSFGKQQDAAVEIYNAIGKKVHAMNVGNTSGTWTINCEQYTPGIYFVLLRTNEKIGVEKVVVE